MYQLSLREKCPNTGLFLVRIFPHSDGIRTRSNSVFGLFSRSVYFRTTNLLLSLYSLLIIKSITYSLAIDFFSQSLVYTKVSITHPIVDIWQNFGYGLRIKRKGKKLYIRKCNNITYKSKKRYSGKKRLVQNYKYLK